MKNPKIEIPENIVAFINTCCVEVGKFTKNRHFDDIFCGIKFFKMNSPIEQMLYCALLTVQRVNDIEWTAPIILDKTTFYSGLAIQPQAQIGKYRVDFKITYHQRYLELPDGSTEGFKNELIVECDSQQFHERTEKERRYEKERERYLKKQGFAVFRYTGKEICEKSLKIAAEILAYLTKREEEYLLTDSNIID